MKDNLKLSKEDAIKLYENKLIGTETISKIREYLESKEEKEDNSEIKEDANG